MDEIEQGYIEDGVNVSFQTDKKAEDNVLALVKRAQELFSSSDSYIDRLKQIDKFYSFREGQTEAGEKAKASGLRNKFQDVNTPVVLEQVEAGVAHQESVFLQGTPLFPVASSREFLDEAMQVEAVLWEEEIKGSWRAHFIKTFRDAYKYNIAAVEVDWKKIPAYGVGTDVAKNLKGGVKTKALWEGNFVTRLNPYTLFYDTSLPPAEVTEFGDYIGYVTPMSFQRFKRFLASLDKGMSQKYGDAFKSTPGAGIYYNSPKDVASRGTADYWDNWLGLTVEAKGKYREYKNDFYVTTLYARICPEALGLGKTSAIQIWKFVVVNNSVVVLAEALDNAHDLFPIVLFQLHEDEFEEETKSTAEYLFGLQSLENALWASVIHARRRSIIDRTIYDPSRIDKSDINSPNPSAAIPVLPNGYGQPVSNAFQPIPFRDDQSGLVMQQVLQLDQYANRITGSNPMKQGQFVKGNKTRFEVQQTLGGSFARDVLLSVQLEARLFTPVKRMLLMNILQYQQADTAYSAAKKKLIQIDPSKLREASLHFKLADGLNPTQNLIDSDVLQTGLQTMMADPRIGSAYEISDLFAYIMQLSGAKINEFKKSPETLRYEQELQAWQQTCITLAKENPDIKPEQFPPQPKAPKAPEEKEGNQNGT